jgi:hypothetical protein
MRIVYFSSLAKTLDTINEIFFCGNSIPKYQRQKAGTWIASRQGRPGSYEHMFAPTVKDFKNGIRVFTGERVTSHAAISHILGEESCRVLIQLNVPLANVRRALRHASRGMIERLEQSIVGHTRGFYCCGICTCALWRNLVVGGLNNAERRLVDGIKTLRRYRNGTGRWRRFPFYYTLLALNEIDLPQARVEMRYAAKVCENYLKRSHTRNKIDQRRKLLVEKVLKTI